MVNLEILFVLFAALYLKQVPSARTSVLAGMTAPHGKNNLGGSGWNTLRTAVKVTSQWGNHKEVHSHVDATDALAELSAATEHERLAHGDHGGSPRR